MDASRRTLLIVEDNAELNDLYVHLCQTALDDLSAEGLSLKGRIEQALDYPQAESILKGQPVDFISIDISLSKREEDLTEEKREEIEPGGITLLQLLQEREGQSIAVVVTGETLQSYATDALQEYGVLAFYQKSRFDINRYKNTVKAAMWYLDAVDLIDMPSTELDIATAETSWKNALEAATRAGIKGRPFPETIGYRLKSIQDELTHSATGLPTGRWTQETLKRRIVGHQDWALIRVSIQGFNQFIATFKSQEESILGLVAGLLQRAREEFQDQELFIGHLGHLEHTLEPCFVLIPGQKGVTRAADITGWIESEFEKTGPQLFKPAFERRSQEEEPTFSIETRVLTGAEHSFPDLHLLLDSLGSTFIE